MEPVFLDIETQSPVDLKTMGARAYAKDKRSRLMMLVATDGVQTVKWIPHCKWPEIKGATHRGGEFPRQLTDWANEGRLFVGHNCDSFDGPFLMEKYGFAPQWYDTLHASRAGGYPGGLDAVSQHLGLGMKEKEGHTLMLRLCKATAQADGAVQYEEGVPVWWEKLLAYNLQDVELTRRLYQATLGAAERDVVGETRAINERGIYADRTWLTQLLGLWDQLVVEGGDRLSDLTGGFLTGATARSNQKVKAWLEVQGVHLDSLNRTALSDLYENPEESLGDCEEASLVVEVLKLRQSMTRAMKGKLQRILLTLDPDSRLRDWCVYYGAHTGRFTSRGIQLHNMSRGKPVDVEAILKGPRTLDHIRQVAGEKYDADDVLATLVRPVLSAAPGNTLLIVDYANVETRFVAWLAQEPALLSAFADPKRDVYSEFIAKVNGISVDQVSKTERHLGKQCVLGMGYGMGKFKFATVAKSYGIDLATCGVIPEEVENKRLFVADHLVQQYRSTYPRVKAMWKEVGRAAETAVRNGSASCCGGRVCFGYGGDTLLCHLPSGRTLCYRSCRFVRGVPAYCALMGLAPFETDLLMYRSVRGADRNLYGGVLVENISQACCRDFMVEALSQLEARGFNPVLHVHDEVACEVPEGHARKGLQEMAVLMSTPPTWAQDFPLRVEGFSCERYVKSAWENSHKVDYMGGYAC